MAAPTPSAATAPTQSSLPLTLLPPASPSPPDHATSGSAAAEAADAAASNAVASNALKAFRGRYLVYVGELPADLLANAVALQCPTSSVISRLQECMEDDGGHGMECNGDRSSSGENGRKRREVEEGSAGTRWGAEEASDGERGAEVICDQRRGAEELSAGSRAATATAGPLFFSVLREDWRMVRAEILPCWPGAKDCLTVWEREGGSEGKVGDEGLREGESADMGVMGRAALRTAQEMRNDGSSSSKGADLLRQRGQGR